MSIARTDETQRSRTGDVPSEREVGTTPLEHLEVAPGPAATELAECIADEHPTLVGRVMCRFVASGAPARWIPCAQGVRPRRGDRVLVVQAAGTPHGVAIAVVSSLEARERHASRRAHARRLRADECIVIESDDGAPIVEVRSGEDGPIVRLLGEGTHLDARGTLTIEADAVALRARRGGVAVEASDDVVVRGEHIHLN